MEVSTIHADPIHGWGSDTSKGGTGGRFSRVVLILAGVAALSATLLTVVYVVVSVAAGCIPLLTVLQIRVASSVRSLPMRSPNGQAHLHRKNYRKPLLQRYVVRILLMYGSNCLDLRPWLTPM